MISVLLVDDHSLIRMGFRLVLDAEDDIEVIGEAADGIAAVSMCSALRPDSRTRRSKISSLMSALGCL